MCRSHEYQRCLELVAEIERKEARDSMIVKCVAIVAFFFFLLILLWN